MLTLFEVSRAVASAKPTRRNNRGQGGLIARPALVQKGGEGRALQGEAPRQITKRRTRYGRQPKEELTQTPSRLLPPRKESATQLLKAQGTWICSSCHSVQHVNERKHLHIEKKPAFHMYSLQQTKHSPWRC